MKKVWMVVAIVAMSVTTGAGRAAAQGPAGAGATAAAQSSSHTPHSYNPIKWVEKKPKTGSDWHDANSERDKKLTAKLQGTGVLAANTNIAEACCHVQSAERLPGGSARQPQPGAGFQLRKIRYDGRADRRGYVRLQRARWRQRSEPGQNDPVAEAGRGCQGRSQECREASERGFEGRRILGRDQISDISVSEIRRQERRKSGPPPRPGRDKRQAGRTRESAKRRLLLGQTAVLEQVF